MLLTATPAERSRLPDQHVLGGYWRRWLKGETIPDAHRSDPNVRGSYRPIIARMMGTTPEKIWPARTPPGTVAGELKDRRDRTADQRRKLDDLRRQVQLIGQLEDSITALEAELRYLDVIVAVPVPGESQTPGAASA